VRLLGPRAGENEIGGIARSQERHRDHRELERRAALQKEHLELVRYGKDLPEERDGFVVHALVDLAAVAHLDKRHAAALEIDQLLRRLLKRRERQHGRTG